MTPAEIKLAALRRLKVVPAGQDASAEDFDTIGDYYSGLHAMLVVKGLATWMLTESVPARCEQPIIAMLSAMAADEFGVPEPRAAVLKAEGLLDLSPVSVAERQLRKAQAKAYVQHSVPSEYF